MTSISKKCQEDKTLFIIMYTIVLIHWPIQKYQQYSSISIIFRAYTAYAAL